MIQGRWVGGLLALLGGVWPAGAVSPIEDSSFGHRLPGSAACAVWWCEGTYKVGRQRALPLGETSRVTIEAARNEYEPFQLVLYPAGPLSNVVVRAEDWVRKGGGGVLASTNVEVRLVEYVPVILPSDAGGSAGLYPDPLVPLPAGLRLEPGQQQPFWVTVYVPKTQPAGEYEGRLLIEAEGWTAPLVVAVNLRVFDFTLSDVTHTRTLYDVAVPERWHGPLTDAEREAVWDLYMANFRRHRVSPQWPQRYAPLAWQWGVGGLLYDFSAFDRALSRYLDEFGFNTFVYLDEPWSLFGHARFTPPYNSLFTLLVSGIASHLRAKGWMEKACAYWIDEPANDLLPFVREGMHVHLYAAPDLRRLLTREPLPELYGLVDLWVPLAVISVFNLTAPRWFERMTAGEEVWWYVATYPKWPVPNYFIDHPAYSHRIRFWLAERYGIGGDLYWDVNWYLDREFQPIDPWTQTTVTNEFGQPMGNGDGVLVYPPVRQPPTNPVVAGPIDSIRWELIREGLEDREYFWLLGELAERAALQWGPDHHAVIAAGMVRTQALALAPALTNAVGDPQALYAARRALAAAIESLVTGEPWWVEEPVSRVVEPGEDPVLRCEALGWPPPVYLWIKDGLPVSATSEGRLRLAAADATTLGDYVVVASNLWGSITSRVARVRGAWEETPQIVTDPKSEAVQLGNPLVLTVVAVGREPLTYTWFKDGTPVVSDGPAGPAFLRSNVVASASGDYWVVVTNDQGAVTSGVARVVVTWDLQSLPVLPTNAVWRYDSRGIPLGPGWWDDAATQTSWSTGVAPFGENLPGVVTSLAGEDGTLAPTVYFLTDLVLPEVELSRYRARLYCDDGAVVYVNGREVFRLNLPEEWLEHGQSARGPVDGAPLEAEFDLPADALRAGTNHLAVQLHQYTESLQPVGIWPFDESDPPWERLGGGLPWVRVGAGVVAGAGRWLGCVSNPAAADSWLELPELPGLRTDRPFTVGGWFRWHFGAVPGATRTALAKPGEFRLYYAGTTLNRYRFQLGSAEVQDQTSGTLPGQWRLVLAWYDGTNACIQLDNGPVYAVPAEAPSATTNPWVALQLEPGAGPFSADDVLIFPRVLSAAERTAIYQLGVRRFVTNLLESTVADAWFELEVVQLLASPPRFVQGPEHLIRFEGESAGFRMTPVGSSPLAYQWLFNGAPVAGATQDLLFLSGLRVSDSGEYSLVATNWAGATTSAPVRLTVYAKPRLEVAPEPDGSGWRFHLPGLPVAGTLEVSTNLQDWVSLAPLPPGLSGTNWFLPVSPDRPAEFYRIRLSR